MRKTRRLPIDDAGHHRLATIEEFGKDPLVSHAEHGKRLFHVGHETIRTAQIHNRVRWYTDGLENRSGKMPLVVEVLTDTIVGARPAIGDTAASVYESRHQAPDLPSERMVLAVP